MNNKLGLVQMMVYTLSPRQNGRRFPDGILKWTFLNVNVWILINISLKFVPRGPIHNIPTLVQVMAWRRPGDKPLSEPMVVRLPTHMYVTRPQWVNRQFYWCIHASLGLYELINQGRVMFIVLFTTKLVISEWSYDYIPTAKAMWVYADKKPYHGLY